MPNGVIVTLASLSAIAATVLAFIFIIPEKKRPTLNGFFRILHDILNFKSLLLELILKASYVFATAYVIFSGFFTIFGKTYDYGYYGRSFGDNLLEGFIMMVAGPIAIRLAYELLMMFVILVKNVTDINKKMGGEKAAEPEQPQYQQEQYQQYQQPRYTACPHCGNVVAPDQTYCNTCGTRVK